MFKVFRYIFQDWPANKNNIKFKLILMLFRIAQIARRSSLYVLFIPYLIFYRVAIEWVLGVELPWNLTVGRNLSIQHGFGLTVNDGCIIGSGCTLRNGVTIGNKVNRDGRTLGSPTLGSCVDVGANVVIIGPITIGNNVRIGAGSVVVKNVPDNCIIAGNPAKIIYYINDSDG